MSADDWGFIILGVGVLVCIAIFIGHIVAIAWKK